MERRARRATLSASAPCCFSVAAVLAGVALMLRAVVPPAHIRTKWILVAKPLAPMAAALYCVMANRRSRDGVAFDRLREPMKADLRMLREVRVP